ncbi:MAG: glycoside hydrolase family 16 protein [Acidimicrobiales bacterium]
MGLTVRTRLGAVAAVCALVTVVGAPVLPARAAGPQVFVDHFDNGGLDLNKWTYLLGEWPTNSQIYVPSQVTFSDSGMHLLASQPPPTTINLAGGVESKQSFLYGEFHVVARLPQDNGLWPAVWLTAGTNAEIDIFEAFGSHPERFQTTVHDWHNGSEDPVQCIQVGWKVKPVNGVGSRCSSWEPRDKSGNRIDWHAAYHDWGMRWTPGSTSFTMDGHQYWSTAWSPSIPMQLVLNDGIGTYWDGYPDGTDVWPASLDIRSVTVNALP